MKLIYPQKKGERIKSQMNGIECFKNIVWDFELKVWVEITSEGNLFSSHAPCKSVRAFRRMLKNAPKGVLFRLRNKYVGCDVFGYGCGNLHYIKS